LGTPHKGVPADSLLARTVHARRSWRDRSQVRSAGLGAAPPNEGFAEPHPVRLDRAPLERRGCGRGLIRRTANSPSTLPTSTISSSRKVDGSQAQSSCVACACRRSWNRVRGSPSSATTRRKSAETVHGDSGSPIPSSNTRSSRLHTSRSAIFRSVCSRRCRRRNVTTKSGRSTLRRAREVFGAVKRELATARVGQGRGDAVNLAPEVDVRPRRAENLPEPLSCTNRHHDRTLYLASSNAFEDRVARLLVRDVQLRSRRPRRTNPGCWVRRDHAPPHGLVQHLGEHPVDVHGCPGRSMSRTRSFTRWTCAGRVSLIATLPVPEEHVPAVRNGYQPSPRMSRS
jgi:hypothetical protein